MKKWQYYNHLMVPTTAPNEMADEEALCHSAFWKENKKAFFARWATDFDCGYETNWWYVIKDTAFDVNSLKAKRRYEINKGIKNFEVKLIDPCAYKEELYSVQVAALSAYPPKYRPTVNKEEFIKGIGGWTKYTVFGAFFRETGELAGYAWLSRTNDTFIDFRVLKTDPAYEKYSVNAALVEKIMEHFENFLSNGGMICDGSRSISHETKFQDYLEKYFGFRKAYCHLHIKYNPRIHWLIRLLYPVRKLLQKLDGIGIVHQINGVLKMEEICRKDRRRETSGSEKTIKQ